MIKNKKRVKCISYLLVLMFVLQLGLGGTHSKVVFAEETNTSSQLKPAKAIKRNAQLNLNKDLVKSIQTDGPRVEKKQSNLTGDKSFIASPNPVPKSDMKNLKEEIEKRSLEVSPQYHDNWIEDYTFVVDEDMYMSYGDYIDADVYIAPDATLHVYGDAIIYGDLINYGVVYLWDRLEAEDAYINDYVDYYDFEQVYYGDVIYIGDGYLYSYEWQSIYDLPTVPLDLYSEFQKTANGYLPLVQGAILPIFDLEIEEEPVSLYSNGSFTLYNYFAGTKNDLEFKIIDFLGQEFYYYQELQETKIVSSLEITKLPSKVHYIYGENLNISGMSVFARYTDGTRSQVSITNNNISGFNSKSNVFGPQTVWVTYGGKKASFTAYLNRFHDVPYGYDFYSTIMDLANKGIVVGYNNGYYGVDDSITRAEVAVMLVRSLGLNINGLESKFTDVPNTHWAAKHIAAASNAKILNGYGDGRFGPNAKITRSELAVMVSKAFKFKINPNNIVSFSDVPKNYWAEAHIQALASNAVLSGYRDGRFGANDNATRAHFSKFLSKSINLKKN